MSNLTYNQAKDEILTQFVSVWGTRPAYYQSVDTDRLSANTSFARVDVFHTAGFQSTLGGAGGRSFTRNGTLTVIIHTPIGKGLQEGYDLAKIVSDAFEGQTTNGGVWFRNVSINESGTDGMFSLINVLVDFQYDERK